MYRVIYYIIIFLLLGAGGMAIANKKAVPAERKQRWLKYFTYVFITGMLIISIFFHFFFWIAWIIAIASSIELLKINIATRSKAGFFILSFLVFFPVVTGFLFFAKRFNDPFLLFIYFQVLIFDGFCQITGQLFGKHLLVPKISPTKTWEGLAGGWLFCIIAGILAAKWLPTTIAGFYFGSLFGLLTGLISFWGDLIASFYKRKVQVKDYSNWLPGQGGFLDRFDSLLFTGAIYYLLYLLIFKDGFSEFLNS